MMQHSENDGCSSDTASTIPILKSKAHDITKREVWVAYKQVKANRGAGGVDGQSLAEFEKDLVNTFTRYGTEWLRAATIRPQWIEKVRDTDGIRQDSSKSSEKPNRTEA